MNNRRTGLILSYVETVINTISGLFLSSFLLRMLGDFEYGLYQSMSAFVNYLVILEFGTGTVMSRNLLVAKGADDPDKKKKITSTLWYMTFVLGIVITAIGIVFGASIGFVYGDKIGVDNIAYAQKVFFIMLAYLIASFMTQTLTGTFMGNENYCMGILIRIFRFASRTVILIVAVTAVESAITIALCDAALSFLIFAFALVYVKRKYSFSFSPKYFDRGVLKESFPLCIALLLQTVINQANNNVDKFIIGIKMNMASVSLYSVAMYIYTMFSSITTKPITMYLPQVAESVRSGLRGKKLTESLIPSGRLVALIGGTILFGFIAVGRQFIEIVYGSAYIEAWLVAIIVLIPVFINMTGENTVNVLDILNKRQARSYMLTVTTALNIVLTVCFVDMWGIIGAVAATAISIVMGQLVLLNIYYYKALSMNIWWLYFKSYCGILPAEVLSSLIGFAAGYFIPNVFLSFVVGGAAFLFSEFTLLMLFGFNGSERKKVKGLFNRIIKFKQNIKR